MKKSIKVGSQFSGVGAFEQSLIRLGIDFKNIYAADWDKYARHTYLLNFEEPEYYVKDVHDTPIKEITEKHGSLDIAMFSPPCQAFSLAGKRLGKEDQRGILFFNSLEFIKENNPRYFIFENVKGLLSHDKQDKNAEYGRTFQEWINYLGGKSVNGVHTFFPIEDSVPYHIYFQVLNAKHYGIPQNRERVFIVGIRDDEDNNFHFPKPFPLEKRLKDILETEVDEKYFLSDKMIDGLINTDHLNSNRINNAIRVGGQGSLTKKHSFDVVKVGHINQDTQASQVFSEDGTSPSICAGTHGYALGYVETQIGTLRTHEDRSGQPVIKVNSNFGNKRLDETLNSKEVPEEDCIIDRYNKTFHTEVSPCISTRTNASSCTHVKISTNNSKGFDEAEEEEDSINFSVPSSTTRRGRVGKKVSQTLDTQCNQGIVTKQLSKQEIEKLEKDKSIIYDLTNDFGEQTREYTEYAPSLRSSRNGLATNVEYTGVAVHPNSKKLEFNGFKDENCPTLLATDYKAPKCIQYNTQRIRRLTPLECFRLMDFNEDFVWNVSDSQAYKQAGNSICVGVLAAIISKLKL